MTHALRVGVVGAGRVGAVLAAALRTAGHEIVAVAGESDASRDRIRALLPGVPTRKPSASRNWRQFRPCAMASEPARWVLPVRRILSPRYKPARC